MNLKVRKTRSAGRGVFATAPIRKGAMILSDHVIEISREQRKTADQTILHDYVFEWKRGTAVSLGWSSLINHSKEPNAYFVRSYPQKRLKIYTLREIAAGEEITIDYGYAVKF